MKCKNSSCDKEVGENPYRGKELLYCNVKCRRIDTVRALRTRRKKEAVDYLGGKCSNCGYDKCLGALHFHHRNPQEKDFGIAKWITFNANKLKAELDKCDLLCANCHAEKHYNGKLAEEV